MASLIRELGYGIKSIEKIDVTTQAGNITGASGTYYVHNAGNNMVYIDTATTVNSDSWELAPGEKAGPFAGQIYYVGADVTTLKVMYMEGV
jgi:hypothetical protein